MLLDFTSQLCFVLANRCIRTSFPVASFSTSWTHLTKSNFYQVQFAGDPIFYQAPLAGGHGVQSGTMSNEATWLYGKQSLISSVYLLREETVELQILLNRCSLFFTMSLTPRIWIRALTIAQFELTSEIRIFGQPLFRISHDSSCCSAFQVFSSFSVLQFCSLANFSCIFDCTFLWVESALTSIQDDGRLLYTTDVKYLDLPLPFSLSFCFARFKVLSEQMLLLNLSKCVDVVLCDVTWSCVMCVCVVVCVCVCVLCVLMLYCVKKKEKRGSAEAEVRRRGGASLKTRTPHVNVGKNTNRNFILKRNTKNDNDNDIYISLKGSKRIN